MKTYQLLRILGVICLLWCSLAFACKTSDDPSSTSDDGTTPTRRTGLNTGGGAITEQEVKKIFTYKWTHDCKNYEACKVTFLTPVRINPKERHTIGGITVDTYPVKVDFAVSHIVNADLGNPTPAGEHHTGGVYYFYRNSFGEWEMGSEGDSMTFDQ